MALKSPLFTSHANGDGGGDSRTYVKNQGAARHSVHGFIQQRCSTRRLHVRRDACYTREYASGKETTDPPGTFWPPGLCSLLGSSPSSSVQKKETIPGGESRDKPQLLPAGPASSTASLRAGLGTFWSYLGDLGELRVGLAAPLGRFHRCFVVVHEGSVEPQLAGLGRKGSTVS